MAHVTQKPCTPWNYIWQPLIIFIFLVAILNIFLLAEHTSNIAWAVGAGSLASSAYLVFAKPSAVAAHPLRLIVAYVLAIVCGLLTHYLGDALLLRQHQFFGLVFSRLCRRCDFIANDLDESRASTRSGNGLGICDRFKRLSYLDCCFGCYYRFSGFENGFGSVAVRFVLAYTQRN